MKKLRVRGGVWDLMVVEALRLRRMRLRGMFCEVPGRGVVG